MRYDRVGYIYNIIYSGVRLTQKRNSGSSSADCPVLCDRDCDVWGTCCCGLGTSFCCDGPGVFTFFGGFLLAFTFSSASWRAFHRSSSSFGGGGLYLGSNGSTVRVSDHAKVNVRDAAELEEWAHIGRLEDDEATSVARALGLFLNPVLEVLQCKGQLERCSGTGRVGPLRTS
ncbi:hypothetical protein F5148DRAFT_391757 [Russula earlei]|uniref:Uncharacterized protein n=1 Tax=Russula earlei TaxID=71964 RepID=A0ACC0TZX5_9AGAM|nr:hypothetical protein F5148DRAFT_391757 [Russula earlei]